MIELKCDIFIEKKDNLISNIFINNLSNNNNELQNEINKVSILNVAKQN